MSGGGLLFNHLLVGRNVIAAWNINTKVEVIPLVKRPLKSRALYNIIILTRTDTCRIPRPPLNKNLTEATCKAHAYKPQIGQNSSLNKKGRGTCYNKPR